MKEKKQRKPDEYITYRVMVAFVASAVFLLLMARLRGVLDVPTTYIQGRLVCLIVAIVSLAGAAAGVVSYFGSIKRETHKRGQVFNGMFFAYFALVVAASALLLYFNHYLGMRAVYIFIPASAILFLIYSVYPKHLFVICATHFYAAFALYGLAKLPEDYLRNLMLFSALGVCALALAAFFATLKNQGKVKIAGVDFIVFGRGAGVKFMAVLYGATAAVLVAAYALGTAVAFYCMLAAIAFIVVIIVHGTVRMM